VTEPLGVAIVGAGYWGPNLLRNFQAYSGTRVRWVCDVDRVRAEAAARHDPLIRTTTSLDDVLSDPGVGAVAVATPAATHVEVALACLETDRHVLIESRSPCRSRRGRSSSRSRRGAGSS
jgi:predicted dehydrogenase